MIMFLLLRDNKTYHHIVTFKTTCKKRFGVTRKTILCGNEKKKKIDVAQKSNLNVDKNK